MKTAKTKCPDLIYCIDCKHFDTIGYMYDSKNKKAVSVDSCDVVTDTTYEYDHVACYKNHTFLKPKKANKDNNCKYFEPKSKPETPKEKKSKFNIFRGWFK